jgi:predicted nuclease of predicted toxin-antitoxin system
MKLLFDQNLSPHLVNRLADIFPGSSHVFLLGFDRAADVEVWRFARDNGYVIVTKDADFGEMSTLHGFPPQVVWLRTGNCTTRKIEDLLRSNRDSIQRMEQESTIGIVSLF